MKTVTAFVFGTFMAFCAWGQEGPISGAITGPAITFEQTAHEFGDIRQGDIVEHVFAFENTGTEPLIITNVQTTCGCTAPSWPRDPIAPGQSQEIKVRFNSTGKTGRQNKVITVVSNATESRSQVKITANILAKKTEGSE